MCNGIADCTNGNDESSCLERCPTDMFRCETGFSSILANSSCIPRVQRCDAIVHCDDGSDEQGCDESCSSDHVG